MEVDIKWNDPVYGCKEFGSRGYEPAGGQFQEKFR